MDELGKIMAEDGIMVLSHGWLAGCFASKENCILEPDDMKGRALLPACRTY
jgi:hypothetical protein